MRLLAAGGASAPIKPLCKDVCDICRICRAWRQPGNRSVTSRHVATRFNEKAEVDLFSWKTNIVLHISDCLIRWTEAGSIRSRETQCVLAALKALWVSRWGPPACFFCLMDREL